MPTNQKDEELLNAKRKILKLKAELRRTQEKSDILKWPPRTLQESTS